MYKSIPVDEQLYALLKNVKESMHLHGFNELLALLVSKPKKASLLGSAPWLKGFEREHEKERE
ncbi:MAG: hypothetical protein AB1626_04005 [Candidatus Micrarchaeota archaeon]